MFCHAIFSCCDTRHKGTNHILWTGGHVSQVISCNDGVDDDNDDNDDDDDDDNNNTKNIKNSNNINNSDNKAYDIAREHEGTERDTPSHGFVIRESHLSYF